MLDIEEALALYSVVPMLGPIHNNRQALLCVLGTVEVFSAERLDKVEMTRK